MKEAIKSFFEKIYIWAAVWYFFLRKEKTYGKKGTGLRKFYLLSKGFYDDHPIPYDFKKYSYSDYVSDLEKVKLSFANYPYQDLLGNKLIFSKCFSSFFKTPESYCILNKGVVEPANCDPFLKSIPDIMDFLFDRKLIFKRVNGSHGRGVLLVEGHRTKGFRINTRETSAAKVEELLRSVDNYLVCEFIEQGSFSKQFFPDTTNTLRILTFCDPLKPSASVLYSLMRFGRPHTIPADNADRGGVRAVIDLKTGVLGDVVETVGNGEIRVHSKHPDTEVQIAGVQIPRWERIVKDLKSVASVIKPLVKIVGWDVVLTEDSYAVIEGNNASDVFAQGIDFPFARNREFLNFMKAYKVR